MYGYIRKFEQMGLGMAIHWGLYSQTGEGEWTMEMKSYGIDRYAGFKDTFSADGFDPLSIAEMASKCGMKFIILTTRHHDGFSLYDTKGLNDFDAMHSPAGRDLIREFVNACKEKGIVPFLYHTTLDWQWRGKKTTDLNKMEFKEYLDYLNRSVKLLCSEYGDIGGFVFDGNWCREDLDWDEGELYRMIRKLQPETIIMNNTGLDRGGELDHEEIDAVTFEQGAVQTFSHGRSTKEVAAMRWQSTNSHWGAADRDLTFKSPLSLIESMTHTRSYGAVHVVNIGLDGRGAVQEMDRAILGQVGKWMDCYGAAYYGGRPTELRCQGRDYINRAGCRAYYFAYDLGIAGHENVTHYDSTQGPRGIKGLKDEIDSIKWMDNLEELSFSQDLEAGLAVFDATGFPYGTNLGVRVAEIVFK